MTSVPSSFVTTSPRFKLEFNAFADSARSRIASFLLSPAVVRAFSASFDSPETVSWSTPSPTTGAALALYSVAHFSNATRSALSDAPCPCGGRSSPARNTRTESNPMPVALAICSAVMSSECSRVISSSFSGADFLISSTLFLAFSFQIPALSGVSPPALGAAALPGGPISKP